MGETKRYSGVAMLLHWLIAIAVIVNWRLAEAADHTDVRADAEAYMGNHMAIGITILVLTLVRLAWRLGHPAPPLPADYVTWERLLARTVHFIFYALLIGLPLGGWLASSFYGQGVDVFGLFTLPALPVAESPNIGEEIFDLHGTGGEAMLILIGLHVLGAIKHMVIDKDGNLWRMLPFGTPKA
ncbi:MAG: cytochrome b [Erythrobacter sp.]|nr:MAG: cytochrome b [Erythrobacter sp.]